MHDCYLCCLFVISITARAMDCVCLVLPTASHLDTLSLPGFYMYSLLYSWADTSTCTLCFTPFVALLVCWDPELCDKGLCTFIYTRCCDVVLFLSFLCNLYHNLMSNDECFLDSFDTCHTYATCLLEIVPVFMSVLAILTCSEMYMNLMLSGPIWLSPYYVY